MTANQIDVEVTKIIHKVGANDNKMTRKFYCKAFWDLKPCTVWNCVEDAMKAKKSKPGLLYYLLNKELDKVRDK